MIDLEHDPVLESRVRRALEAVANSTAVDEGPWDESARVERTRTPRLMTVAAALLVVAGAVGVWQLTTRTAPTGPTSSLPRPPLVAPPPPIVPPKPAAPEGTEYPIRRVPPFELGRVADGGPVINGSSLGYSQTADATQYTYRTLDVQGDYVVERSCVSAIVPDVTRPSEVITGTGCTNTLESSLRPHTGTLSQHMDGQPESGFWRWSNVPPDTDFVQFRSGELLLWQRPIDGYVHFATGSPDSANAVAYRADGAVLAIVDAATVAAAGEVATEFFADLNRDSRIGSADVELARNGVQVQFARCLESRGVVLESSGEYQRVAFPRNGDDIEPAWQACLVDSQRWLDAFIDDHS